MKIYCGELWRIIPMQKWERHNWAEEETDLPFLNLQGTLKLFRFVPKLKQIVYASMAMGCSMRGGITLMKCFLVVERSSWSEAALSHQQPAPPAFEGIHMFAPNRMAGRSTTESTTVNKHNPDSSSLNLFTQYFRRRETFSYVIFVEKRILMLSSLDSYSPCNRRDGGHVVDSSTTYGRASPQKKYMLHRWKRESVSTIIFKILLHCRMRKHINKWWAIVQKSLL